jgi:hypothetical protein
MRGAKYAIAPTTKIANRVKIIVAPCARLNAAPEFRIRVNCRKSPIILVGLLALKLLIAQTFVAKSKSQTAQAIV